ncbi:MAG: lytic transglycosylase F [Roseibium sp.]|nr:lytic transglycosylase F [Roseibium sp.]
MLKRLVAPLAALLIGTGPVLALETASPMERAVTERFVGDYDEMKRDRIVRVLIPYSITDYYLEKGQEKGLAAEYLRLFEERLNKGVRKEADKVRVVLLPTRRDLLIGGLEEGIGDIAAADLTITPDRLKQVDFTDPVRSGVREILVTRSDLADVTQEADLAGLEVHVRASSSYHDSLLALNDRLGKAGLDELGIRQVDEILEDEDLMEMVAADLLPATVVDEYKADLWLKIFKDLKIHRDVALRDEAEIAWAFRKDSPLLAKELNGFIAETKIGTKLGNILANRYSKDATKIINPKTEAYQKRLDELIALFEKIGAKYEIDPMLLAAQAFQESRLNNNAKSRVGAVGIMQVLPSTARDRSVGVKNFRELEGNIEAGAKYNRFVADTYFDDPDISELDQILFVLASYNAGPNRVARVRKNAKDPNTWFGEVEWQVLKAAGAEPIKYVKNIYIYYVVFSRLYEYDKQRKATSVEKAD